MSRGKEYKGQTLVIDGSKSGASVVITRLSYDSAFNLQFIGEARYGSKETDQYWYLEKLLYDSAFNLETIQTAQNRRAIAEGTVTINQNVLTVGTSGFIDDLLPGTLIVETLVDSSGVVTSSNNYSVVSTSIVRNPQNEIIGYEITLNDGATPTQLTASLYIVSLEDYILKDFNKRAWTARKLYIYE